jgi:hypothetical protein
MKYHSISLVTQYPSIGSNEDLTKLYPQYRDEDLQGWPGAAVDYLGHLNVAQHVLCLQHRLNKPGLNYKRES